MTPAAFRYGTPRAVTLWWPVITAAHVVAEVRLVLCRARRTRFGVWTLALFAATTALAIHAGVTDAGRTAARLGVLTALMGAGFCAAADADRAVLDLARVHPVTSLALAAGRWAALALLAGAVASLHVAVLALAGPWRPAAAAAGVAAGIGGAGAAAGAGLCAAWLGGNGLVGGLFAYVVLASGVPPDVWVVLARPGVLRTAGVAVLEFLPGLWRYRELAAGDPAAWLHAGAWAGGGVAVAARLLTGRRR
jgi:hypothetical protein